MKVLDQMAKGLKQGYIAPMTNRFKVWYYVQGGTCDTNNFAFEVKVILGLESTCPDGQGAKTGLNGPMTNMVKV